MSNGDDFDLSAELQQFMILAAGLGLDNLQKLDALMPMVLTARGEEYGMCVLAVDGNEVMKAAAEHVAALPAETSFYALMFDGKMNVEGTIINAVIVQAGERGADHGHLIYQPYDPKTRQAVGAPEYAGHVEQFLR